MKGFSLKISFLVILSFCTFNIIFAQKTTLLVKHQFVEVQSEIIIQTIANQPNCPVKFENLKFFAGLEGGGSNSFHLRNIGKKPIISVTIGSTTRAVNTYRNYGKVLIAPGQLWSEGNDPRDEIVPLTDELQKKLKLTDPMKSFIIMMVVNIEFADGTKFNDEKTFNALQEYMERLWEAIDQAEEQKIKP